MIITFNVPDYWTQYIDQARQRLGFRSRSALMQALLRDNCAIPGSSMTVQRGNASARVIIADSDSWPFHDLHFIEGACPACIAGNHCQHGPAGDGVVYVSPDQASKTRQRFICDCPGCGPVIRDASGT